MIQELKSIDNNNDYYNENENLKILNKKTYLNDIHEDIENENFQTATIQKINNKKRQIKFASSNLTLKSFANNEVNLDKSFLLQNEDVELNRSFSEKKAVFNVFDENKQINHDSSSITIKATHFQNLNYNSNNLVLKQTVSPSNGVYKNLKLKKEASERTPTGSTINSKILREHLNFNTNTVEGYRHTNTNIDFHKTNTTNNLYNNRGRNNLISNTNLKLSKNSSADNKKFRNSTSIRNFSNFRSYLKKNNFTFKDKIQNQNKDYPIKPITTTKTIVIKKNDTVQNFDKFIDKHNLNNDTEFSTKNNYKVLTSKISNILAKKNTYISSNTLDEIKNSIRNINSNNFNESSDKSKSDIQLSSSFNNEIDKDKGKSLVNYNNANYFFINKNLNTILYIENNINFTIKNLEQNCSNCKKKVVQIDSKKNIFNTTLDYRKFSSEKNFLSVTDNKFKRYVTNLNSSNLKNERLTKSPDLIHEYSYDTKPILNSIKENDSLNNSCKDINLKHQHKKTNTITNNNISIIDDDMTGGLGSSRNHNFKKNANNDSYRDLDSSKFKTKRDHNEEIIKVNSPLFEYFIAKKFQAGIKNDLKSNQEEIIPVMIFLIVDDEPLIRKSNIRLLTNYFAKNYTGKPIEILFLEAEDGLESIYIIYLLETQGKKVNLLITDESMKFMRGSDSIALINKFKSNHLFTSDMSIFFCSAYSKENSNLNGLDLKYTDHITKPLNLCRIKEMLEKAFII